METNEEKTIELSLNTLLRECTVDRTKSQGIFNTICLENRENLHEIFKYQKFNNDFSRYVTGYIDENNIVRFIRPSYNEFLENLQIYLNVKPTKVDDDKLTEKLLERVEVLRNIEKEYELKKEFPLLYQDLQYGRKFISKVKNALKEAKEGTPIYELEKKKEHYYYATAMQRSLPYFIKCQVDCYTRFIKDREKLKKLQEKKSCNRFIKGNLNLTKFYLYVAHECLRKCEDSKNKDEIKSYLEVAKKYIKNIDSVNYNGNNLYIITDDNTRIDINNVKARCNNQLNRVSDDSNEVDWILIPEGRDLKKVKKEETITDRETLFNYEELERLRKIGERKSNFFESSGYIARAIGLRRYAGYVAYIYKNGEVLLDREYERDNPNTAIGNAIYNMKAINFEKLSKLDKTTLRNNPHVKRIIHSKYWEDKAKKIIEKEGTEEEQESSVQLVKKLKGKS